MIKTIKQIRWKKIIKIASPLSLLLYAFICYSISSNNPGIQSSKIYILSASIIGFIWFCSIFFLFFFFKTYKIIGDINFNKEYINVNNENISIQDINEIKFVYTGIYGDSKGGMVVSHGDNNKISISLKDGKLICFTILLEKKSVLEVFKRILKYYRDQGINVVYKEDFDKI